MQHQQHTNLSNPKNNGKRKMWNKFFHTNDGQIIFIFLILLSFNGFTQLTNKKKVLVVPYNRFEFVSEFSIEEIAEKNKVTEQEVFLLYQKTILNAFENYQDENFEFIAVKHQYISPLKNKIKYKNGKFNGNRYNMVDLKDFTEKEFEQFLFNHNCDFVVFITWYDIQKEAVIKNVERRKRYAYAGHYFDFDIFNLFKQRIMGKGRVKAEAPEPQNLQVNFALLRTKELSEAYKNFVAQIIEVLNNPIQ